MSNTDSKAVWQSLTFICLFLLVTFNVIGEGRFDFLFSYADQMVEALLIAGAGWGRWRATTRVDRVL